MVVNRFLLQLRSLNRRGLPLIKSTLWVHEAPLSLLGLLGSAPPVVRLRTASRLVLRGAHLLARLVESLSKELHAGHASRPEWLLSGRARRLRVDLLPQVLRLEAGPLLLLVRHVPLDQ